LTPCTFEPAISALLSHSIKKYTPPAPLSYTFRKPNSCRHLNSKERCACLIGPVAPSYLHPLPCLATSIIVGARLCERADSSRLFPPCAALGISPLFAIFTTCTERLPSCPLFLIHHRYHNHCESVHSVGKACSREPLLSVRVKRLSLGYCRLDSKILDFSGLSLAFVHQARPLCQQTAFAQLFLDSQPVCYLVNCCTSTQVGLLVCASFILLTEYKSTTAQLSVWGRLQSTHLDIGECRMAVQVGRTHCMSCPSAASSDMTGPASFQAATISPPSFVSVLGCGVPSLRFIFSIFPPSSEPPARHFLHVGG
jgi:hypothetical protein